MGTQALTKLTNCASNFAHCNAPPPPLSPKYVLQPPEKFGWAAASSWFRALCACLMCISKSWHKIHPHRAPLAAFGNELYIFGGKKRHCAQLASIHLFGGKRVANQTIGTLRSTCAIVHNCTIECQFCTQHAQLHKRFFEMPPRIVMCKTKKHAF